jgi:SAM-dependent methyltransferase
VSVAAVGSVKSRMKDVGDLAKNREYYIRTRFPNLTFLFKKRFEWMADYIRGTDEVLEVGAGIGVTKLFLTKGHITLSDIEAHPWMDSREDALNLSWKDESVDVIIANNMIHHLPQPLRFFAEAHRVLRRGGRLLIQDVNCGFFMRRLLRLMKIEDFDFTVDVFDVSKDCTNPSGGHWDGNAAIPNILFDDVSKFEKHVSTFKVLEQTRSEFLVYICSGGINGKTFRIPLPYGVLKVLDSLDGLLVRLMPRAFALQMHVVLEKR